MKSKDKPGYGPDNPHPLSTRKTELVWEGKYDEYGNRREVDIAGCAMPMQKIETIDEPAKGLINELLLPLVPSSELGFLSGITYQRIERNNPGPALESVKRVILAKKQQIESNQAFLIIGGILALLFITASGE